jgi:hypothetical protein
MIDVLLSAAGDLEIMNGDLVMGRSDLQHQRLLLFTDKGELRQYPTAGVGLRTYLLDEVRSATITAAVKRGFEADGMKVRRVRVRNRAIETDASYE